MQGHPLTCFACAALTFILLSLPLSSLSQELTFFPRLLNTQGDLELSMNASSSDFQQGGVGYRTSSTYFQEKVNLAADGYIYHPRFQLFLARVSGALNQGSQWGGSGSGTSGGASDGQWRSTATMDYELRTIFLPEHPYNLELFALHREPSGASYFWQRLNATVDQQGANFNYRQKPYFFHAGYYQQTVESPSSTTETKTYRANGSYIGKVMTHSASYGHTDSDSSQTGHGTRETYAYNNLIRLSGSSLDSRYDGSLSDQQQRPDTTLRTRQNNWTELLTVPLPWNFGFDASFRSTTQTDRTEAEGSGQPAVELSNRYSNTTVNLNHRLYQSLTTHYGHTDSTIRSSTGELDTRSDFLNGTYVKLIPTGRLTAGVQFGRTLTDRKGTPYILDEVHAAPLLGSFLLNLQNVITDSITVRVKDPVTAELVTMPTSNYLVDQLGTSVRITVLSVFPAATSPNPSYLYEFHTDYSLSDQAMIETTTKGYSLRADLWENLLSPYYSFVTSDQEVLSGSIPGGPEHYENETIGVASEAGPYSGSVERQWYRSDLNPWESWRARAQYRKPAGEDTNVTVSLYYLRTDHLTSSRFPDSTEYRDTVTGTDVMLSTRFPMEHASLSLTSSYYQTRSTIDSSTFMFNAYGNWQLGLLTVSGGAQISRLKSMPPSGDVVYDTQYYYVTVSRKLF